MTDLRRLAPADARTLLALAGSSLLAKRQNAGPEEWISIEGPEATDDALRDATHRILVQKRRALGMEPVDLTYLVEPGRWPDQPLPAAEIRPYTKELAGANVRLHQRRPVAIG